LSFLKEKGSWQMAKSKKPDTHIGNGHGKPILAESASTAAQSKPSPPDTGKERKTTKPVSVTEALSLWQTAFFDLQQYGFKTAILARDNKVFILLSPPASIGNITFMEGHFLVDGLPVSDL
jgi:hypothetical protein